jgi:hypothetical protein
MEEKIQTPPDAVVVEQRHFWGPDSQEFRDPTVGPLAQLIEGMAREEHVAQEDLKRFPGSELPASIGTREMLGKEVLEPEALEEAIDDGQGPHLQGLDTLAGDAPSFFLHGLTSHILEYIIL